MSTERRHPHQRGLTLIELIVFIVIVSVGLAGVLAVFNVTVKSSADPMIRKQMLSIAEALMEEVTAQSFTYCDPTDANVTTASGTAGCATTVQGLGPGTTGQTRTSTVSPFNNVPDYYAAGGLAISPVTDVTGTYSYAGYSATIVVDGSAATSLNGIAADGTAANLNVVRIAVTVAHGADSLTLEGYRTRHSPNSTP